MIKKLAIALLVGVYLVGCGLVWYPTIERAIAARRDETVRRSFDESCRAMQAQSAAQAENAAPADTPPVPPLLAQMQAYNERIFAEKQKGLTDAWSYETSDFTEEGFDPAEPIAWLEIDAMELQLPVYLGASKENMKKGAGLLGQTSLPTGGPNTNCVLAAHRGYNAQPMFREIERLQLGDTVRLTNFWQTLTYQVSDIQVIYPHQIEVVRIRPDQDMLTLLTCHPYRENSHRYVVYLTRVQDQQPGAAPTQEQQQALADRAEQYGSSAAVIEEELLLTKIGQVVLTGITLVLAAVLAVQAVRRRARR